MLTFMIQFNIIGKKKLLMLQGWNCYSLLQFHTFYADCRYQLWINHWIATINQKIIIRWIIQRNYSKEQFFIQYSKNVRTIPTSLNIKY